MLAERRGDYWLVMCLQRTDKNLNLKVCVKFPSDFDSVVYQTDLTMVLRSNAYVMRAPLLSQLIQASVFLLCDVDKMLFQMMVSS